MALALGILVVLVAACAVVAGAVLLLPKNEKSVPKGSVDDFLKKALESYILAYQTKRVEMLEPFVTVPCLMDLANKIMYHNVKNFDEKSHRHVVWTPHGDVDNDGTQIFRLDITFDKIKSRGYERFMRYGDPIQEFWKVIEMSPKIYRVMGVREINEYDQ